MNDNVEARKIFQPSCLTMHEDLGCGEVLEVLVVSNDIDWGARTLEIVSQLFKGFIYHE